MLSKRLFWPSLTALMLLTALTATTSAQQTTCTVTGNPLTVRSDGLAELTGDVIMSCVGGTAIPAGGTVPTVNISLTLTTRITSRLLTGNLTEALLFVDDPQGVAQNPCAAASGVCTLLGGTMTSNGAGGSLGTGSQLGAASPINVFQGIKQSDNTIVWMGVPLNPPGTGIRLFRIKNIRVAISGFSVPDNQIVGSLSIQNPPSNFQLNNATAIVGFVQPGLSFALRSISGGDFTSSPTLSQCVDFNRDLAGDPTKLYNSSNGRVFELRYREGSNAAFKKRVAAGGFQNIPQNIYNTESGFVNPSFTSQNGLNRAGLADHGTRLLARFANVPANVRLYVSAHAISSGPLVTGANWSGGGETSNLVSVYGVVANTVGANTTSSTVPVTPLSQAETGGVGLPPSTIPGLVAVPLSGGAGSFTWEIFSADDVGLDTVSLAVTYAYTASSNTGAGTPTVNGTLAPLSTVNTADAVAPSPRFGDASAPTIAVPINTCGVTPPPTNVPTPSTAPFASVQQMIEPFTSNGMIDSKGISQSLLKQLAAAESAAMRGQGKAAQKILGAMANHINAQTGKHIDSTAAQQLLEAIASLMSSI
jgi:hypothetical protein